MWRKPAEAKPSPLPSKGFAADEMAVSPASISAPVPVSTPPLAPLTRSESAVSSGLRIHGEISGTSDLYIDGEARGKIRLETSRVTIGPNGRVQADIEGREIVVQGSVKGNLKASERIRLGNSSRVQGSLLAPAVAIDEGARLRGKVETVRASESQGGSARIVEKDSESKNVRPVGVHAESE
jgi:cytoskeletal protein CcmA (bactofilin family)